MKIQKLTQLAALSAAFCAASSFAASNDALLDLLVQKGVLTETEATDVAAELKAEQPVFVKAKGKAVKDIKLTGRIHAQYDGISNDDDSKSGQNGFYLRRLYLGAEAKFDNGWYGKLIANFGGEHDSVAVDKAVIGWKYEPAANFEFGYTKVPFGLYETTSSSKIKTVERPIANRLFAESDGLQLAARNAGVFVNGDLGGGFSYSAAVVSNDPSNSFSDKQDDEAGNSNGLGFFGRLEWENDNFLVGVDLAHKQDGAKNLDAGAGWMPNAGDINAYGIHAVYTYEGFRLSGEFLGGTIENANSQVGSVGDDVDVYGFTIMPSYKINDKWEVVASYSMVDSDGANVIDATDLVRRSNSGDEYDEGESVYIGFNYYIIGNDLKLSGGYEHATFEDTAGGKEIDIDALRLRLQLLF